MGTFLSQMHIPGHRQEAIVEALRGMRGLPAVVGPAKSGWVTVYVGPDREVEPHVLSDMGQAISGTLEGAVFVFDLEDSSIFSYWLWERGRLLDKYVSRPGFFKGQPQAPEGGKPEIVVRFCPRGTTADQLQPLLRLRRRVWPEYEAACIPGRENWTFFQRFVAYWATSRVKSALEDYMLYELAWRLGISHDHARLSFGEVFKGGQPPPNFVRVP